MRKQNFTFDLYGKLVFLSYTDFYPVLFSPIILRRSDINLETGNESCKKLVICVEYFWFHKMKWQYCFEYVLEHLRKMEARGHLPGEHCEV